MSQGDGDEVDPFDALSTLPKTTANPAARRTAFRRDPRGVLIFGKSSQCRIARESAGLRVRKSGSRVRVEESCALQFASFLHLPVPAIYEVKTSSQETEIVMDFVDGECLEEAWLAMDAEQKRNIALQIRHILVTMRQAASDHRDMGAPSGSPRIGAFGGPARDCRQLSDYSGGPFDTEAEFNEFVLDLLQGTPSTIRSTLTQALDTNHQIVFTHGDLTPRNIIVKGDRVQALLDWEYAGWYPEYWEYVKFFDRPTDCKDWKEYAEFIFDTRYPKDLLTFQALARWQKP